MAQPPRRTILGMIFKNFINSLKPRRYNGDLMGQDYFGNKYYEIPVNPSIGKRRASRWFEPPEKDNFEQELSPEWEAWLRFRRKDPPEEEEIMKNLSIMQIKKRNAIAIEAKAGTKTPMLKGMETFPKRNEYELIPGKGPTEQN